MNSGPSEWGRPERVKEYLARTIPHRDTAEELLRQALPERVERVLDLGTGDGRMLAFVIADRPDAAGVGIDASEAMLQRARERFAGAESIEIRGDDLRRPLTETGRFDVVVSGLAIHHLADERKRALFAEIHGLLRPGGLLANLDLCSPPNEVTHTMFRAAVGRTEDDPEDRLSPLADQLVWLRELGFTEVDCRFKWLELTLITATRS